MKTMRIVLLLCAMLALCCTAALAESEPTLLAHYTFDDAENLGADASGNGNDLVKAIAPDGIKAVEGVQNGGVYFGGTSGLLAKDDANNDFMDIYGSNPFTISFFAKVDLENARTGNARVVDEGINGSNEGFTMLVNKSVANDGAVSLTGISKVGGSDWWGSAAKVTENADGWHHYVMVYDPANELVVAFVDGVRMSETYAEENEVVAGVFTFCVGGNWAQWDWFNGGNREVTAEGFCGTVDEVKVFAGAVYDMEVITGGVTLPISTDPTANYSVLRETGTYTAVPGNAQHESLEAWYAFDDAENIGKDSSDKGNDLDRTINPDGISVVPDGVNNSAARFGGSSALTTSANGWEDFADQIDGSLTLSYYAKTDESSDGRGFMRVVDNGVNGSANGFTSLINRNNDPAYDALQNIGVAGTDWWSGYGDILAGNGNDMDGWHHYVMVYDKENGTMRTFIDGAQKANITLNGNENTANDFSFSVGGAWAQYDWFNGGDNSVAIQGFAGTLDDVKLFSSAIDDMDVIEGNGDIINFVPDPTVYYNNNTVCVLGPSFRDIENPVTEKWYTFLPIDLTQSGTATYPLVGGNVYVIGDISVTVDGDKVTANYRYYTPKVRGDKTIDHAQHIDFIPDYAAATTERVEGDDTAFVFGQTYSIDEDLGGAEQVLLFVRNTASFRSSNDAIARHSVASNLRMFRETAAALGLNYTK